VNTTRSRRWLRIGLTMLAMAALLAILRPWTVVPIQTAAPRTFEPASYVASIWSARVLPTAEASAVDLQAFMQGQTSRGSARAVFVKGTAKVAEVDRKSRVGLVRLTLPWTKDGRAAIQIGPVLRGTALRDALEFIRFTDFVNQLEFAAVAGALNEHVAATVLHAVPDLSPGAEVTFIGAVPWSSSAQPLDIVPVKLVIGGGAR
jgi:predicted lipoprotein